MIQIAIGPEMPGWGSWEWIGERLAGALKQYFNVSVFRTWDPTLQPDVVVVVKQLPPLDWAQSRLRRGKIIYVPVDFFGSVTEIKDVAEVLTCCARILVHCEALAKYFSPYAPTLSIDHDVNFITPIRKKFVRSGYVLWVGARSNIEPTVQWLNNNTLTHPLRLLSNFEFGKPIPSPEELGICQPINVQIRRWSRATHLHSALHCVGAFDIKSLDFRSEHKPPAKINDFLASGIPVACEPSSSTGKYLAQNGFNCVSPADPERWHSRQYWNECRQFGQTLLQKYSPRTVSERYRDIIKKVTQEYRSRFHVQAQTTSQNTLTNSTDSVIQEGKSPAAQDTKGFCIQNKTPKSHSVFPAHKTDLSIIKVAVEPAARIKAIALNDEAVKKAIAGDLVAASHLLHNALQLDSQSEVARINLDLVEGTLATDRVRHRNDVLCNRNINAFEVGELPIRVAIVSFLFNWPSHGGGIVHTVELAEFLLKAGYEINHVFARFAPWGIGEVTQPISHPHVAITFTDAEWSLQTILERYRQEVEAFQPDYVIVTDSWNIKPLLADALKDFRVIFRLQAMECLCPLNNVRLLAEPDGKPRQCTRHQLATPSDCHQCVSERRNQSGPLHRRERALCNIESESYQKTLRSSLAQAEAILVVNPLTAALIGPYSERVQVVTAGMDPDRFANAVSPPDHRDGSPVRILFAGLIEEWMKGFHVLQDAASLLWQTRKDFEVIATADPVGQVNDYTRFVGWQDQKQLPELIGECDILAMPTIAQEALGRTAVEAMAAGRPVVASRIGGLPATVLEEATGLLFEPGNYFDLARKLNRLIQNADLRQEMGKAGRKRFEENYSWPVIIEKHYRPLLKATRNPVKSHNIDR